MTAYDASALTVTVIGMTTGKVIEKYSFGTKVQIFLTSSGNMRVRS